MQANIICTGMYYLHTHSCRSLGHVYADNRRNRRVQKNIIYTGMYPLHTHTVVDGLGRQQTSRKVLFTQESIIHTHTQLLMGSATYTPIIDEWSTGCITLEMLTGRCPLMGRVEVYIYIYTHTYTGCITPGLVQCAMQSVKSRYSDFRFRLVCYDRFSLVCYIKWKVRYTVTIS